MAVRPEQIHQFGDHTLEPVYDDGALEMVLGSITDFNRRHRSLHGVPIRPYLAIELVDRLRNSDVPSQTLGGALLDTIEWRAWTELRIKHQNPDPQEAQNTRVQQFLAEQQIYADLAALDRQSGGSQNTYEDVLSCFHIARLVVRNPQDIVVRERRSIDKFDLGKMLATHRVIKALHSTGFSRTRLPNLEERDKKIDAVVPLGISGVRSISLQIQPSPDWNHEIRTYDMRGKKPHQGRLLLHLPFDSREPNHFDLSAEDKATLHAGVNLLRAHMLAFRAFE